MSGAAITIIILREKKHSKKGGKKMLLTSTLSSDLTPGSKGEEISQWPGVFPISYHPLKDAYIYWN